MALENSSRHKPIRKTHISLTILIVSLILAVMSAAGCSSNTISGNSNASSPGDQTPASTASSSTYSIKVFSGNNELTTLKLADLLKLPQISVTADGKQQSGPSLLSVLESVGIKGFSSVSAYGYNQGRLATAELTLNKSQINQQIVLDISKRNTAKLAGPDIPNNSWIIDVNKLVIQ